MILVKTMLRNKIDDLIQEILMIHRNEVADLKTILFPYLMCSAVFKGDMAQLQYCLDQV